MFKMCVEVTTLNTLHNKMRPALVIYLLNNSNFKIIHLGLVG